MSEYQPTILTLRGENSQSSFVTLEILPHGLTIHRFIVWADGKAHDIVVGPEAPKDHEFQKYTNSIIGRYTNRIPIGDHTIERHSIKGNFTPQPNESPIVSLHGGPKGFDVAEWTRLGAHADTKLFTQAELSEISKLMHDTYSIFRLVSADADQGFPGNLVVEVLVALLPPGGEKSDLRPQDVKIGSVVLIYRAKLDENGRKVVTPVNLTQESENHWGFNLNASLDHGSLSVKNHNLTIRSNKVAELDKDKIPTGTFLKTAEHSVHLHEGKKIGESFPVKGYDDFYLFEGIETFPPSVYSLNAFHSDTDLITSVLHPGNERPVVELESELSRIKLCFQTNR
ncbi:hypothetical protein APHAL10511_008111 [Amanita phalloides]|nr:hypothetical protein APHAL10511_008111 [Amanita phalloides]